MMMTKANTRIAAALLTATLALPSLGCGDDGPGTSPFADTYQVVLHTRNTENCDGEGSPFDGDDYFELTDEGDSLAYHVCDAADDCRDAVNDSKSFTIQDGDAWIGRTIDASGTRGGCNVTFTERVATLENDTDVRIETRTFSGEFSREEGQDCTDQLVLENRGELTCGQFEVVLAVPAD
jgi:hypothetical protein